MKRWCWMWLWVALASAHAATLDELLTQLREQDLLRGSYAVLDHGVPVAQGRIDAGPPASYRIGSISKIFTAVLTLQLVEAGQLALDAPVVQHLPGVDARITVEHLLRHRAGLADVTQAPDFEAWARQPRTPGELMEHVLAAPLEHAPGERMRYSNPGYLLLHALVEKVGGKPYAEQLRERITAPLGLKDTGLTPEGVGLGSFQFDGSRWQPVRSTHPSVPGGAGAVVSTPQDLTRFIRALFKGELLPAARVAEMTRWVDGAGQGLFPIPAALGEGFGHEGVIDGYRAALVYLPQPDLAVAVTANAERWPRDALVQALVQSRLQPEAQQPDLRPQAQDWTLRLAAPPLPSGQRYALRGSLAPLSWQRGTLFDREGRLRLRWSGIAGLPLEAKLVIEDAQGQVVSWERGDNRRWLPGSAPGPLRFNVKGEAEALWREIEAADAGLFAALNARDLAGLAPYFSERLEFFHDAGGLAGKAQTLRQTEQNFARAGVRVRREALPESFAIYPVPGLGAMHIGQHRFCAKEGEAPEQCSLYGFSHVWAKEEGQWRLLRVLSYGH